MTVVTTGVTPAPVGVQRRAVALAAGAAAMVVAVSGCSPTVAGTARPAGAGTGPGAAAPSAPASQAAPAPGVVPGQLDPGRYPTRPLPPMGAAGTAVEGGLAESRRMAEFVVLPFEIDPELVRTAPKVSGVIKDYAALGDMLPRSVIDPAGAHGFVAGFSALASGTDPVAGKRLHTAVVRFAAPQDAGAAAAALTARSAILPMGAGTTTRTRSLAVPGHPDTAAVTATGASAELALAYTAHGPYLLIQFVQAPTTEVAARLVAATLDKQAPRIDAFVATPAGDLAGLPRDPDGLWARTLPAEENSPSWGDYGPHGPLAFSSDPPGDQRMYAEAGVDRVVRAAATVDRARDDAAAQKIADELTAVVPGLGLIADPAVPGLPGAHCFGTPAQAVKADHYCVMSTGRYAFSVEGDTAVAARQQLTAQYLMLTAS